MTPEESEQTAAVGTAIFHNISNLIFSTGLFGAYILAFIISMHIILQRKHNGPAHKALIALLLGGFVMSALLACASCVGNLLQVKSAFVVSLSGGVLTQEKAASLKAVPMISLQEWSGNFIILIADIAIIWRAWVLWAENKLIKCMLMIILLADIGINIADPIADTKLDISLNININAVTLDWVSAVLNLTVNIVATLLIAHRAWTHHQFTCATLRNKKTQVEAILLLMVESGAIFGVVQIAIIIFNILDIQAASFSPVDSATALLEVLYICIAALNPVALVILIQTGNTYEHSSHLEDVTSQEFNSVPNIN
ncbi:hypothetical protein BT96DRAFT_981285 [Gymnopus androsaceus JB14]|uniref:Uncharacterized protein n=1 Tax=Gymnopus androsaceus JB14 TaxID=1447944 RepID=A0A6A4GQ86_9AGAR|nr:hypothetical protein BT96DRAFT_981285 [Gymnopus androsaceus JB14]